MTSTKIQTPLNTILHEDGIAGVQAMPEHSVHLILSDIPYGIGLDTWDVLHENTNSALLGSSPAQQRAGQVFRKRGKPLNGWSEADREIPAQYQKWCETFARSWKDALVPGGSAIVFAGRRLAARCTVAFEDAGFTFKDSLAWVKTNAPHRGQRISGIFDRRGDAKSAEEWEGWRVGNLRPIYEPILWFVKPYPIGTTIVDNVLRHGVGAYNESAYAGLVGAPDNLIRAGFETGESRLHIAQKPERLMRVLIELTTKPGQLVLDPFCGSGTTLAAAKACGRMYLGFEDNLEYAQIAQKRLGAPTPTSGLNDKRPLP